MKHLIVCAVAALIALGACGDDDQLAEPDQKLLDAGKPVDMEAMKARSAIVRGSHELIQRGYECGWHIGWQRTIERARHAQPDAFRSKTVGRVFTLGFVMLVAGVAATFFLAWLLPRLARRRAKKAELSDGVAKPPSWPTFFKDLLVRFLQRIGRLLHVELFDPVLASQRTQAIYVGRDAERQLTVALECVAALAPDAPPEASSSAVKGAIEHWKAEIESLRVRLEGAGGLPRELSAEIVLPRLEDVRRAARDVRVGLERAVTMGTKLEDGAWLAWSQRVSERPPTPKQQHGDADLLPTWVKPAGWIGLGILALAVPMMALWMAAGAFPLFFAFLFAFTGLVAVTVARVYLARAGRIPLLPGFADRVASWLTTVCALTFVAVVISSWTSSESGLDLGDPPPLPLPDPAAMEATDYWSGGPIKTK